MFVPGVNAVSVQRVVMPVSGAVSWTVIGRDGVPLEPVESYLAYLAALERSPNTQRAYATSLKLDSPVRSTTPHCTISQCSLRWLKHKALLRCPALSGFALDMFVFRCIQRWPRQMPTM